MRLQRAGGHASAVVFTKYGTCFRKYVSVLFIIYQEPASMVSRDNVDALHDPILDLEEIIEMMKDRELIRLAIEAAGHAYVPYSHFCVGAALLCEDDTVYQGANIENAAYPVCHCAERTALVRAAFEGRRDFKKIAIVGKPEDAPDYGICAPCGVCRQALREFTDPDSFQVLLARSEEDYEVYTLSQLLPLGFTGADMERNLPADEAAAVRKIRKM